MVSRKTILLMVLGIAAFMFVYWNYVKHERIANISKYINDPRIGDIYKLQEQERYSNELNVFYLKVKDVGNESVYFYPGRMTAAGGLNDIMLSHYDSSEENIKVYTRKELGSIAAGQWRVPSHNMTELLEIERR